jgi:hypothetical protein
MRPIRRIVRSVCGAVQYVQGKDTAPTLCLSAVFTDRREVLQAEVTRLGAIVDDARASLLGAKPA